MSSRVSVVPRDRREPVPLRRSMSPSVISSGSDRRCPDSSTTIAVISLVIEAIGSTAAALRSSSTSPVFWLTT